jgi:hypothetical protein
MGKLTKAARLAVFCRRLMEAPACAMQAEAYETGDRLMREVEDEFSGVPYAPQNWRSDGRLYWPLPDSARTEASGVTRYRSLGHVTTIGTNGAVEIRVLFGEVILAKPGSDGRSIDELLRSRVSDD